MTLTLLPNILNPCATCCPVQTQACPAAVSGSISIAAPDEPDDSLSVSVDVLKDRFLLLISLLIPTGSTGAGGRDWRTGELGN
jgi:hypothetical protein